MAIPRRVVPLTVNLTNRVPRYPRDVVPLAILPPDQDPMLNFVTVVPPGPGPDDQVVPPGPGPDDQRSDDQGVVVGVHAPPDNPGPIVDVLPPSFDAITDICCIGASSQSCVMHMAVIAERYPGINVFVTDFDEQLIDRWIQQQIAFEEQGMQQLLHQMMAANLNFVDDVDVAIQTSQMIFIGVEIPITPSEGFDLGSWTKAIRRIVKEANTPKIIIERSTMPIDSDDMTTTYLARDDGLPAVQFSVLSNPDFSSPGARLQDLRNPNRVIIGLKSNVGSVIPLQQLYMGLVQNAQAIRIVPRPNAVNVEIAKLATNAMLSMKLTYINSISSLCNKTRGADINIVRQILGEDYRFENNYLTPTLGIGGPELIKDTLYMKYAFLQVGLYNEAMLNANIAHLDKKRRKEFVQLMLKKMLSLRNRRIAIFGVTYKAGVLDLTGSPAISICKALLRKHAFLQIYETAVDEERIRQSLGNPNRVTVFGNPVNACHGAHAVAFLVPLPPQIQLNFQVISNEMRNEPGGRYLFMGCHMDVDLDGLRQMGFTVYVNGKP